MPKDMREPQSYGSEKDWTTGTTGGQVNDQKSTPPAEHQEFYDDRRESEESASYQGGRTSPVQLAERAPEQVSESDSPGAVPRVSTEEGGARRDSFFKRRDYE